MASLMPIKFQKIVSENITLTLRNYTSRVDFLLRNMGKKYNLSEIDHLHIFLMFYKDFYLRPVVNASIYLSLIAQVVKIRVENSSFCGVNFSLGPTSKGRAFYGMQLHDDDLKYRQDYNNSEYFYLSFNKKEEKKQDEFFVFI